MDGNPGTSETKANPSPLGRNERRVLGVLVEKAKTTPDNYPMSIAAIIAGSNQKSNRSPLMQLDEDDVQLALDNLRTAGASREIQASGRVAKFRHLAYEWLGVEGDGVAIMTELLLRGPQTLGELRARASRMHDFADLDAVASVVAALQTAGLVQAMTPPGRGQAFAHKLYPPDEQRHLAAKIASIQSVDDDDEPTSQAPVSRQNAAESESRIVAVEARLAELQQRLDELEAKILS